MNKPEKKDNKSNASDKQVRDDIRENTLLFYTASVNKVVSGGRKLRFVNYVVYCKDEYFGMGKGKSATFLDSLHKASYLAKKNSKKYFVNHISIPRVNIKFKATKLLFVPRRDRTIISSTLITNIFDKMKVNKGISIRTLKSKHKINVVMAVWKFLELTNQIYEQYERPKLSHEK